MNVKTLGRNDRPDLHGWGGLRWTLALREVALYWGCPRTMQYEVPRDSSQSEAMAEAVRATGLLALV